MLCIWIEDPNSEAFNLHLPRIYDVLWVAEDEMKIQIWAVMVASFGTQLLLFRKFCQLIFMSNLVLHSRRLTDSLKVHKSLKIAPVILIFGTATSPKVHGPFPQQIMGDLSQIAQQKDLSPLVI